MKKSSDVPEVPVAGVVYGQIAYWILLLGLIVALVGSVICMVSGSNSGGSTELDYVWRGDTVVAIWESCAGFATPPSGHWYLQALPHGDGVSMLGIAISCVAAVLGMWGASLTMLRRSIQQTHDRLTRLYFLFALIIAVILTLSAVGILALE